MFIKDIKILGGIHNRDTWYADVSEEQLATLAEKIAIVIREVTDQPAYINIEYTKAIGHKLK